MTSDEFVAKRDGTCDNCMKPVEVGQMARYDETGKLVHAACKVPKAGKVYYSRRDVG